MAVAAGAVWPWRDGRARAALGAAPGVTLRQCGRILSPPARPVSRAIATGSDADAAFVVASHCRAQARAGHRRGRPHGAKREPSVVPTAACTIHLHTDPAHARRRGG